MKHDDEFTPHDWRIIGRLADDAAYRLSRMRRLWCEGKSIYHYGEDRTTFYRGIDILALAGLDADRDRNVLREESAKLENQWSADLGSIPNSELSIFGGVNDQPIMDRLNSEAAEKVRQFAEYATAKGSPSPQPERKRRSRDEIETRLDEAAVRIRRLKSRPAKSKRELAKEAGVSRSKVVDDYWQRHFATTPAPKVVEYCDNLYGIGPDEEGADLWSEEVENLKLQQQRDMASDGLPQRRKI